MSGLLNKMLNFVGWEGEEEEEVMVMEHEDNKDKSLQQQFSQPGIKRQQNNKVVSLHTSSQFKVVIMQPEDFDDAQSICDHLKTKKPVVINLEKVEKDVAQRVIDFLSGSVYALDGNIQKVSNGIFLIAPCNVDIMGDIKDQLRNKGVFPWVK